MEAMSVGGVHVHSMTPEEAYHARRGTDWEYDEVYRRLRDAGLDSVPGLPRRFSWTKSVK